MNLSVLIYFKTRVQLVEWLIFDHKHNTTGMD